MTVLPLSAQFAAVLRPLGDVHDVPVLRWELKSALCQYGNSNFRVTQFRQHSHIGGGRLRTGLLA